MNFTDFRFAIASAISEDVALRRVNDTQAQVYVPFSFPDGDGLVVHVRDAGAGRVEITDNAHTFMHLSYDQDPEVLLKGARGQRLEAIRRRHGVQERDGEMHLETDVQDIGRGVFAFAQALLEIVEMSASLERSRVTATFREDLNRLLTEAFGRELIEGYRDPQHDPAGEYPIPYVLNGVSRPIGIFDVLNDAAAQEATVIAQEHRKWGRDFYLVAVEKKQEELNRRYLARLSNAVDKQFASFEGNQEEIVEHVQNQHHISVLLDQGTSGAA